VTHRREEKRWRRKEKKIDKMTKDRERMRK